MRAKINSIDEVSPWEDSISVLMRVQHYKQTKRYESSCDGHPKTNKQARPALNRDSLNLSKINLHEPDVEPNGEMVRENSRKYMGPRISFYSKMNPQVNQSLIKQDTFCLTNRSFTDHMCSSKKLLEIIQDSPGMAKRPGLQKLFKQLQYSTLDYEHVKDHTSKRMSYGINFGRFKSIYKERQTRFG